MPKSLGPQRPGTDRVGCHVEEVGVQAESGEHAPRVLKPLLFTHAGGGGACPDGFKIKARAMALNKKLGMTSRPGDLGMDGSPYPLRRYGSCRYSSQKADSNCSLSLALEPPPQLVGVL
jgi:hypothetical protein